MRHQPTLFMRIHKTAGEALARQIGDRLPGHLVCPAEFEWRIRRLPTSELRSFSFFQGHISPAALSEAFPALRVFTMLRSPRERLLSCFFYWKEGSKHARTEFFNLIASMSLSDFLRSENPIIRRVTWNAQARLLAGGQFGGADHQRQAVFGPSLSETELANEALRGLQRFAFTGTTETYEISLRRVYAMLELGPPPEPQRFNVTGSKPASYDALLANSEIAESLSRLTEVDQIVYDEVCRTIVDDGDGRSMPALSRPALAGNNTSVA